jgi:hypothetical protein
MNITKSYLTDATGQIQSVVLDYHTYQTIEQVLLDEGLMKAMAEVAAEEEVDYEEVRELIKLL